MTRFRRRLPLLQWSCLASALVFVVLGCAAIKPPTSAPTRAAFAVTTAKPVVSAATTVTPIYAASDTAVPTPSRDTPGKWHSHADDPNSRKRIGNSGTFEHTG
ncbi:MAG: hypothetical protein HY741_23935 [Chloroflexi bacterium]|nr:hypothetical protein [Chloroflexota bacterium]